MRARKPTHRRHVEDGLRHGELRPRFDLVFEAPDFLVEIERARVGGHTDVKGGRLADRLPADVEPAVELRRQVREPD